MSARRTKFYLDKKNAKAMGVCAGIADYMGIDVLWVRIGAVLVTLAGGFPWTVIAYLLAAWMAEPKPTGLYADREDERFWQGVRTNPARSTRDVRSKFRDIDRRLSDIETFYTSRNTRLADEIDSLR
ncbi:phage shock protein C [Sphingobium sp. B2D3A]|uniref:envelope stress response membrane protein PspC n=1 Tax=Sphingobium TaxID=165695 RepID=UPI0015ECD2DB|nr:MULTISPECIES: envelope stress response membrane protein PspC [Sphingobium]MCW2336166.1 phage shock protein C [Sphingobium sp. B2D3A]MCW2348621.1 phage shock protein C [Sphingobium sp. B12D2B]MCW2363723.1 phage shock protein C [Sphingobium sp. B10D3B]MCW2364945.1 phage shock protein C [Sphingobium sp. B7D2B]MCW2371035.1 phage shock protein C [Sphingobium sp. B11D3D]